MEPGSNPPFLADVRLCGYLRKQKSRRRRYFVLRCGGEQGPPRLEYYENEKKFRAGGPLGSRPKKTLPLGGMLTINKRADARHQHLIVLCGREGTFGVAAESAEQQQTWYLALMELRGKGEFFGSLCQSQNLPSGGDQPDKGHLWGVFSASDPIRALCQPGSIRLRSYRSSSPPGSRAMYVSVLMARMPPPNSSTGLAALLPPSWPLWGLL
ncbi:Insulin receptor substrate 1, partial [Ophiophagus hannah]